MILQRGRHEVEGCVVRLAAERAAADPKVFTRIHLSFTVSGRKLPREAVERAVRLSHDKYCSATQMLGATATITHDIDIVDTEAA
jgi:putative redox protein